MWKYFIGLLILGICSLPTVAQTVEGKVIYQSESGEDIPIPFANVYWLGTQVGTTTDTLGIFSLSKVEETNKLVVSYVGFESDTTTVTSNESILVSLKSSVELDDVEITHRIQSNRISYLNPIKTEEISEKELFKAACCNLSESFETNPSVDVSFNDAITGARQIQMLGLAGKYSMISFENMPGIRGVSTPAGMGFIPGAWIQSIQLSKGTGSVVNGYESMTGQVNVEFKKPDEHPNLFINGYVNQSSRMELNAVGGTQVSDKWKTAVLAHVSNRPNETDNNKDGFTDNPTGQQVNFINRWKYENPNGHMGQIVLRFFDDQKEGGQLKTTNSDNIWRSNISNQHAEVWAKKGFVFKETPYKSYAIQAKGLTHKMRMDLGNKRFKADEKMLYGNFIYQSIIGTTDHQFRTGASILYNEFDKSYVNLSDTLTPELNWGRTEIVPGAYFEHTFNHKEVFNMVSGLRVDYHNTLGLFITPRINARWALSETSVLRGAVGRGWRTSHPIMENGAALASSRQLIFKDVKNPGEYKAEDAWNFGLNFTKDFKLNYRDGSFSVDLYRTHFTNQLVADLDANSNELTFYNLDGKSYANSLQVQMNYEPIRKLDVKVAYRLFDVKTQFQTGLLEKPLIARHRAFINLAYTTKKHFAIDYTLHWQGKKRLPYTGDNSEALQLGEYSKPFWLMNMQVSKTWNDKFEWYLGVENLLDFRQNDPILDAENPFSNDFDASIVWGPIFGRNIYTGFRWWIGEKE